MKINHFSLFAILITASLLFWGCATDDSKVETGKSALEATNECVIGCQERGIDEPTCAELCSSIGGNKCIDRCIERGGDEARCTAGCQSGGEGCYEGCIERGGDAETCRLACTRPEGGESSPAVICTDGEETIRDGVTYLCENGDWTVVE